MKGLLKQGSMKLVYLYFLWCVLNFERDSEESLERNEQEKELCKGLEVEHSGKKLGSELIGPLLYQEQKYQAKGSRN